jgi:hypothetical protein
MSQDKSQRFHGSLKKFQDVEKITTKGPLATVLFLTRRAKEQGLPFPLKNLKTEKQGQVAGLGREPVQKILAEHGIHKTLAEEGGRTSRGSLGLAEKYINLLNKLHDESVLNDPDLKSIELWWIDKVKFYFNRQCFKLDIDSNISISKVVSSVLREARKRQEESQGSTIEGTVLQHLVGAKLSLVLKKIDIRHHGSNVADAPGARAGDFHISDSVIHVTTSPTERLIEKCRENLSKALRPIIVCPKEKVPGTIYLAENAGIKDRVEVFDAESFISTNINEIAGFEGAKLKTTTQDLFKRYNEIVQVENDPSLLIEEK